MSNTIDVIAAGRVSVEPRVSQGNTHSCIRFAFPRKRKDDQSSWLSVEVWVPNARLPYLTDRLKKGAVVSVTGTLECEVYQGKERWFIKTNDVTILSNSPDYVSRYGDQQGEPRAEEHGGDQGYPDASGYAPPGTLPVLGEHAYGNPHPGYEHANHGHRGYAQAPSNPAPAQGYGHPPQGGYGPAPTPTPPPGYVPPRQGYAPPAPPPNVAVPSPQPPPQAPAAGVLKF